jgi:hypothetical protein
VHDTLYRWLSGEGIDKKASFFRDAFLNLSEIIISLYHSLEEGNP